MKYSTIYVVGNQSEPKDNLAPKVAHILTLQFPEISFVSFDPTEELPDEANELVFLDTVEGISKVTCFSNLHNFSSSPRVTVHDFDLYSMLTLLMKLHKIESFIIIGLPMRKKADTLIDDVKKILLSI